MNSLFICKVGKVLYSPVAHVCSINIDIEYLFNVLYQYKRSITRHYMLGYLTQNDIVELIQFVIEN